MFINNKQKNTGFKIFNTEYNISKSNIGKVFSVHILIFISIKFGLQFLFVYSVNHSQGLCNVLLKFWPTLFCKQFSIRYFFWCSLMNSILQVSSYIFKWIRVRWLTRLPNYFYIVMFKPFTSCCVSVEFPSCWKIHLFNLQIMIINKLPIYSDTSLHSWCLFQSYLTLQIIILHHMCFIVENCLFVHRRAYLDLIMV